MDYDIPKMEDSRLFLRQRPAYIATLPPSETAKPAFSLDMRPRDGFFTFGPVALEGGLSAATNLRAKFYETTIGEGRLTVGVEFDTSPLVARYLDTGSKMRAGNMGFSIVYHFSRSGRKPGGVIPGFSFPKKDSSFMPR